jgi:hypothetical protein
MEPRPPTRAIMRPPAAGLSIVSERMSPIVIGQIQKRSPQSTQSSQRKQFSAFFAISAVKFFYRAVASFIKT